MATEPFAYCLNTSTIKGQALSLTAEIELAAKVGYQGIEPWIEEIDCFTEAGGSLRDLARTIADQGLTVPSAIGFFEWIVNDDAVRAKGLEEARRNMDLVAQLGGKLIAAPAFGAQEDHHEKIDLLQAAERYRALFELGREYGVVPMVELWGFSKNLNRLGEVICVAVESDQRQASLLLDVYHLHKGGSGFSSLQWVPGESIGLFHFNDYPAEPPPATVTDAHRVYPGDGVAPLTTILRDLHAIGYRGMLSLELFNESYWQGEPLDIARTGLDKMRRAVEQSKL